VTTGPAAPPEIPAAPGELERRGVLNRRVPGAQLPATALRLTGQAGPDRHPARDAPAARKAMDGFQNALTRAGAPPVPVPPPRPAPLSRRTPGANLAPGLREAAMSSAAPRRVTPAPQRDPDAERAAFDGYAASLAQAARHTGSGPTGRDPLPSRTKESRS